ncbi:predicted protein [Arabidopsis lyrata subsp. lyrata]|uniref:Predicted protein n=1 Tax=Arabidopsis lyrata subsp. lyrata TaxID=81972 RepID=D7LSY1_ARALL|nr:predicted protein [Arabidopsis lyrata subsp. lyrata]
MKQRKRKFAFRFKFCNPSDSRKQNKDESSVGYLVLIMNKYDDSSMEEVFFFFFLVHGGRCWVRGGIQMSEQDLWLG